MANANGAQATDVAQVERARNVFADAMAMPRASRTYDFPRMIPGTVDPLRPGSGEPIGKITICPLTRNEVLSATSDAERKVRAELKRNDGGIPGKEDQSLGYPKMFQEALWSEIIFRASYSSDDATLKTKFFRSPTDVSNLYEDELGVLAHLYEVAKFECGPVIAEMGEDEMDGYMSTLVKAANFGPLASLSLGLLIRLIVFLACRLFASPTDRSSSGSPLDDGESGSTSTPNDEELSPTGSDASEK